VADFHRLPEHPFALSVNVYHELPGFRAGARSATKTKCGLAFYKASPHQCQNVSTAVGTTGRSC